MSEVLLYRLRMNRDAILQDLESDQVLDYLYQEDVLDGEKYEEVRDKGPRRKQAALLLSYVERDSSAIQKMIDALENSCQRHLAYILKDELPDEVKLSRGGFLHVRSKKIVYIFPLDRRLFFTKCKHRIGLDFFPSCIIRPHRWTK